ncbi:TetR/AcrR family transcriptional regulator [Lolliginicoccus suaedae]|uniref:TetR/AcrR family transcriptional regulator n=1 Tax=Lolliginicoccus suaedae TaxID=2605429 RepID=UPI001F1D18B3|nr:TetR/AcrR family transcriptional regulator [Lolliginicoccus suaedae]
MPPSEKGTATRARMVESMLELIQSHGYCGTGTTTMLEHAGAPKGSMYFHFPGGKEQIAEQAIAVAGERFHDMITGLVEEGMPPGQLLARLIDTLASLLADSDYQLGCPVSVVTLEVGASNARLREACASAYASWIGPLADYLASRGMPGERALDLAATIVSTVEGAMIVSRANRHTDPLRRAARVLGPLLDSEAHHPQEKKS